MNDFNVTALFLSCNVIHVYFPCPPPCHTIILKSHLFPSLKNKGKCISSELPCKTAAYSSLFVTFCQIPELWCSFPSLLHLFPWGCSGGAAWSHTGRRELSWCERVLRCCGLRSSKIFAGILVGVKNIIWYGSDDVKNVLCSTSSVRKLWSRVVMGLQCSINHILVLLRVWDLAVKFLAWLINKSGLNVFQFYPCKSQR